MVFVIKHLHKRKSRLFKLSDGVIKEETLYLKQVTTANLKFDHVCITTSI